MAVADELVFLKYMTASSSTILQLGIVTCEALVPVIYHPPIAIGVYPSFATFIFFSIPVLPFIVVDDILRLSDTI